MWFIVREAAAGRKGISTTSSSKAGSSSTTDSERVLVAMMVKFLLSRLMPTALDVVEHAIGPDQFTVSHVLTACVDTSNLIVVVASAANFFIFYAVSASFRKTFALTCHCCGACACSLALPKRNSHRTKLPESLLSSHGCDTSGGELGSESLPRHAEGLAHCQQPFQVGCTCMFSLSIKSFN